MLTTRDKLQHIPLVSFLDAYPEPSFVLSSSSLQPSQLDFIYGNHALHVLLFGHDDGGVLDDQSFFSALTSDEDIFWLDNLIRGSSFLSARTIAIRPAWLPRDHAPLDLEFIPTPIELPVVICGAGSTTRSHVFTASPRKTMNLLRSETHLEPQRRRDPGLRLSDFPPLPASVEQRLRSKKSKSESTSWLSQPTPAISLAELPSRLIEIFPWEKTSLGPKESWPTALKIMSKYLMEKPIPVCLNCSLNDRI